MTGRTADGHRSGLPFDSTHRYDDIIGLPHHRSSRHVPMPQGKRAAQFMPFAALAGYDAIIAEAARETQTRIAPGPDERERINAVLRELLHGRRTVSVTYFRGDPVKSGGRYVTVQGTAHYDVADRRLAVDGESSVPVDDIVAMDIVSDD